jgi:hypothetical protein
MTMLYKNVYFVVGEGCTPSAGASNKRKVVQACNGELLINDNDFKVVPCKDKEEYLRLMSSKETVIGCLHFEPKEELGGLYFVYRPKMQVEIVSICRSDLKRVIRVWQYDTPEGPATPSVSPPTPAPKGVPSTPSVAPVQVKKKPVINPLDQSDLNNDMGSLQIADNSISEDSKDTTK